VGLTRNPFGSLHMPQALTGAADQIRMEFAQKFDFIQSLADSFADMAPIAKSAVGEAAVARRRVGTGFDLRVDQVICGAEGVDPAGKSINGSYVMFLIKGSSYTRRGSRSAESSIATWISVQITEVAGGRSATFRLQTFDDASLLRASYWLRRRIRETVAAVLPAIAFTDTLEAEPPVDLSFDQPPTGALPVLGKFSARYGFGPTGCTLKLVDPDGCVEKAGLKVKDIVKKFNGSPMGVTDFNTDLLTPAVAAAVARNAQLEILVYETGEVKNVALSLDPLI
jgi:hypothetical protein